MKRNINRYPLISFFIITYLFSWTMVLPLLLGTNGLGILEYRIPRNIAFLLTMLFSFGPLFSALITAFLTGYGTKCLLKRYLKWRVNIFWYIAALVFAPITIVLGAMIIRGISIWQVLAPQGIGDLLSLIVTFFINLLVLFFIGGPLGEEAGWRGVALPRLQNIFNPLVASILLGIIWALWHLPSFYIPEMGTFQKYCNIHLNSLSFIYHSHLDL